MDEFANFQIGELEERLEMTANNTPEDSIDDNFGLKVSLWNV